jgi:hypothetical protein
MSLFGTPITEYYRSQIQICVGLVDKMAENLITEVDARKHAEKITEDIILQALPDDLGKSTSATVIMEDILGSAHPAEMKMDVEKNTRYPRAIVRVNYEHPGNSRLMNYAPTGATFKHKVDVHSNENQFSLRYNTWHGQAILPEDVKAKYKAAMKEITAGIGKNFKLLNAEAERLNEFLVKTVEDRINQRKAEIQEKRDQDDDLNDF